MRTHLDNQIADHCKDIRAQKAAINAQGVCLNDEELQNHIDTLQAAEDYQFGRIIQIMNNGELSL